MTLVDIELMKLAAANLTDHHIQGYARMARGSSGEFSCPLISHVWENIWQGGTPAEVGALPAEFLTVVNLYPWESYRVEEGTTQVIARLYDSEDGASEGQLRFLSDAVVAANEIGPVLVHCQAGLNRSALVTGLALVKLGLPRLDALGLLRRRSPAVLCNRAFERRLLDGR